MKELNNSFSGSTTKEELFKVLFHNRFDQRNINIYHRMIKEVIGVRYAYSFGSGRGALYAIMMACGIGSGDEVILQGYTCVAVPKAVMYTGAKPVYADITREDYNLDYNSVLKKITTKTKAIIVQHTYGIPCHSIYRIKETCKKNGIIMIEDCAHTFGVKTDGYMMGTIGDAAFFSTDNTKYISTGVGGIAVTNDPAIGKNLKKQYEMAGEMTKKEKASIRISFIMDYFFSNKHWMYLAENSIFFKVLKITATRVVKMIMCTYDMADYTEIEFPCYTFPARLSEIQAIIGISQIKNLESNIQHRRELTRIYLEGLSNILDFPKDSVALLRVPVCVGNPLDFKKHFESVAFLERWFSPEIQCIDRSDYSKIYFDPRECPVAESVSREIINLPTAPRVSRDRAKNICKIVRRVLEP